MPQKFRCATSLSSKTKLSTAITLCYSMDNNVLLRYRDYCAGTVCKFATLEER